MATKRPVSSADCGLLVKGTSDAETPMQKTFVFRTGNPKPHATARRISPSALCNFHDVPLNVGACDAPYSGHSPIMAGSLFVGLTATKQRKNTRSLTRMKEGPS